jgi:hypothetical protein
VGGRPRKRRNVLVALFGQVTKVTTAPKGCVDVTFRCVPAQAEEAYKAGKYIDKGMILELRSRD